MLQRNRNIESLHMNWFVKSSFIYYAFLILFVCVFLFSSSSLILDVRKPYAVSIVDNVIAVEVNEDIPFINDVAYLYVNRNDGVFPVHIVSVEYLQDYAIIHLGEDIALMGEATLEVTIAKQTLLARIFTKAGRN